MDDLIFFLILIAVIIVVAIAAYYFIKNNKKNNHIEHFDQHGAHIDDILLKDSQFNSDKGMSREDMPDSFSTDDGVIGPVRRVSAAQSIKIVHMPLPQGMSDMIIAMSIQRNNHLFSGEEIVTACKENQLQYGYMNIFHYPGDKKPETFALFSVANMVEPGTFTLDEMDSFTTPGLSLFMQLPLPINAREAYQVFVKKAQALAKSLHADLYDDQFNLISQQIINHNLEKISAYQHDLKIAQKKQGS